jgi:hypothetical protein
MTAITTPPAANSETPGLTWFGDSRPPSKKPLRSNVFETMLNHQGMQQQKELFPYFSEGDLVPAAAFSYSLPDLPRFHFYHYNDQQEIVVCMAAEGGSLKTGQLYVQNTTHGVTTFLKNPNAPEMEAYQVCIITIRMKDEGPQNEAKMFRCSSCNEVVFRYDRDILDTEPHKYYQELPNVRLYADAVDAFNATDRICPSCGKEQDQFPQDVAGWRRYAQYVTLANRARDEIALAADAAASDERVGARDR